MPAIALRHVLLALVPLMLTACPKPGPPPTSIVASAVSSFAATATPMTAAAMQQRMTIL